MMGTLKQVIKTKRAFISIGLLASFSAIFLYGQLINQRASAIRDITNGLQTCYTRVNQTYTAKMISDTGAEYLSPEFMMTSEECLSDVLSAGEEIFKGSSTFLLSKINKMIADTHWFHEKLDGKSSLFSKPVSKEDLSDRFEKIEVLKDTIADGAQSEVAALEHSQKALNIAMGIMGFIAVFLFIWEIREQRERVKNNLLIERDAEIELMTNGIPQSSRVEQVFSRAFENNDLTQCAQLFDKYHSSILDGQMSYLIAKDYHEDGRDQQTEIQNGEEENIVADYDIQLVTAPEESQDNSDDIHMDNILSQIVEHVSASVFHKGVRFELTVDDDIKVNSEHDILEQIFFHSLNYAIASCEEVAQKRVNVKLHRLGGTAIFEIEDSGIGFDPLLIKKELGISRSSDELLPLELKIVKELVMETKAELSLENILADDGTVVGGRIRVVFRLQQDRNLNRGLVQIRKATKKELAREFSQSV